MAEGIKGAGKKEHGHDQKIRGEVKTLHVFDHRTQCHSKRCERDGDHGYEAECRHEVDPVRWTEAGENADQKNQCSLEHAYGCSAERAADHEINSRHRRNQSLLEESELAISDQAAVRNLPVEVPC